MSKIFKLLILTAIFYLSSFIVNSQKNIVDQAIAVVGKNIILKSDIENQYVQMMSQEYISKSDLKCDILEEFLYQKLLLNQAELDSIEITLQEVEYAMDNRFRQIINKVGSEDKLEEYFGKSILEMKEDLKQEMKNQLLIQKMQGKVTEDLKITPTEVRKYFNEIHEDSLPTINETYEIEQIVKFPKIKDEDKEVVKEKLKELRERIINGDKFSTLAVLYSEDPGSAPKGGELGFVSRADLVSEFAAVAFNLKDPEEVSRIVETEFGYHIIQLIKKKGEFVNVRHILLSPKVSPNEMVKAKNVLDSISTLVKIDSLTFVKAAEKFSDDENSKNTGGLVVNYYTGNSQFEKEHLDANTYYNIKSLKIGDISKPFESKNEKGKTVYKIVRLKSKTNAHKINLKDDYQRVQDVALADKKQKVLNNWIKQRQTSTYIHIDESYQNCNFEMKGWIK